MILNEEAVLLQWSSLKVRPKQVGVTLIRWQLETVEVKKVHVKL